MTAEITPMSAPLFVSGEGRRRAEFFRLTVPLVFLFLRHQSLDSRRQSVTQFVDVYRQFPVIVATRTTPARRRRRGAHGLQLPQRAGKARGGTRDALHLSAVGGAARLRDDDVQDADLALDHARQSVGGAEEIARGGRLADQRRRVRSRRGWGRGWRRRHEPRRALKPPPPAELVDAQMQRRLAAAESVGDSFGWRVGLLVLP